MIKEIGGYFEFEELIKNEYYKNLISLNTGRNALLYILKCKNIEKIYIPYYLCDVIYETLEKNNYKYDFYRITQNFLPDFDKKLLEHEYLYIVNYYGQISNKKLLELKQKYKNIIVDNTHAFFQEALKEIATIYNCRKWFGVPDGAYLSIDINLNEKLKIDFSKNRTVHLLGRYEGVASDYYSYFKEVDEKFRAEEIKLMSKLTKNILGAIDYEKIKEIRKENYQYLYNQFKNINKLKLNEVEIPFGYPLYLDNVEEIRKHLIKNKIYIPILWPNVLKESSKESIEYKYSKNILLIPCDQRYNLKDMEYITKNIKSKIGGQL